MPSNCLGSNSLSPTIFVFIGIFILVAFAVAIAGIIITTNNVKKELKRRNIKIKFPINQSGAEKDIVPAQTTECAYCGAQTDASKSKCDHCGAKLKKAK